MNDRDTNDWLAMRAEALILHERLTRHPAPKTAELAKAIIDRADELQSLGFEAMHAFAATTRDRKRMS